MRVLKGRIRAFKRRQRNIVCGFDITRATFPWWRSQPQTEGQPITLERLREAIRRLTVG